MLNKSDSDDNEPDINTYGLISLMKLEYDILAMEQYKNLAIFYSNEVKYMKLIMKLLN